MGLADYLERKVLCLLSDGLVEPAAISILSIGERELNSSSVKKEFLGCGWSTVLEVGGTGSISRN